MRKKHWEVLFLRARRSWFVNDDRENGRRFLEVRPGSVHYIPEIRLIV